MTTSTLVCTCNNFSRRWDHNMECELWDDPDFIACTHWWDPDTNSVVRAPADAFNVFVSEQGFNEDDEVDDGDIELDEGIDVLDVVLDKLLEGKGKTQEQFAQIYDEATNFIGDDMLKIINLMMERPIFLYPDELEKLEEFSADLHIGLDPKVDLPIFDCQCMGQVKSDCPDCGVYSVGVGDANAKHFAPRPERLLKEVEMWLDGKQYLCDCPEKKKGLICNTHKVQRYTSMAPWTYYNSQQKVVSSSSQSTNYYDSDYWGWDGAGTTTFVGKCRHYSQEVVFPDGTKIWASSSHTRKPDDPHPDFGIYMYDTWPNDVLAYKLHWADYGLPYLSDNDVITAADHGVQMAREDKIVEIGCMGGHGRTGTFMAIMLYRTGWNGSPDEAIDWVHANYCKEAIEGDSQEWYIAKIHALVNDLPIPRKPCTYSEHKVLFEKKVTCDCKEWAKDFAELSKPKPAYTSTAAAISKWTCLPKADESKATGKLTCSLRRHEILFWRHAACTCSLWANDKKRFEGDKTVKQADKPLPKADWPKGDQHLDKVPALATS
jgi:hypothetical protein